MQNSLNTTSRNKAEKKRSSQMKLFWIVHCIRQDEQIGVLNIPT